MKLLLLGSNYFQRALKELGHDVIWAGAHPDCDCRSEDWDVDLASLIPRLPFKPEAVILTDDLGKRVLPLGFEQVEATRVWYAVDSPINHFWQRHYASRFDLVLVDQRDYAKSLEKHAPSSRVSWLPVAVDTTLYQGPPACKCYDLAFVGVINDRVRPKRSRIIKLLSKRYNVHTAGGRLGQWVSAPQSAQIYRQSQIVLNENLFSGVNTRVLEAMASGAMLLTEGHESLSELFDIGVDLDVYSPDSLYDQVDYYLAHPDRREQVAASGYEKVMSGHDISNRARRVVDLIAEFQGTGSEAISPPQGEHEGEALFFAALRWPAYDGAARIARAEHGLNKALVQGLANSESLYCLGQIAALKGEAAGSRQFLNLAAEAGHLRAQIGLALMELPKNVALAKLRNLAARYDLDFPQSKSGNRLSADQHHVLGKILEVAGHDLTPGFSKYRLNMTMWDALEHYRAAVEIQPDHLPALVALGTILARHDAYVEAQAFFDRAMEIQPRWPGLAEKSTLAYQMGYGWAESDRKVA